MLSENTTFRRQHTQKNREWIVTCTQFAALRLNWHPVWVLRPFLGVVTWVFHYQEHHKVRAY